MYAFQFCVRAIACVLLIAPVNFTHVNSSNVRVYSSFNLNNSAVMANSEKQSNYKEKQKKKKEEKEKLMKIFQFTLSYINELPLTIITRNSTCYISVPYLKKEREKKERKREKILFRVFPFHCFM